MCVLVSNYQLILLTFGLAAALFGLDVRLYSLSIINCYLVLVLFLQSCIYLLSESQSHNNICWYTLAQAEFVCPLSCFLKQSKTILGSSAS